MIDYCYNVFIIVTLTDVKAKVIQEIARKEIEIIACYTHFLVCYQLFGGKFGNSSFSKITTPIISLSVWQICKKIENNFGIGQNRSTLVHGFRQEQNLSVIVDCFRSCAGEQANAHCPLTNYFS